MAPQWPVVESIERLYLDARSAAGEKTTAQSPGELPAREHNCGFELCVDTDEGAVEHTCWKLRFPNLFLLVVEYKCRLKLEIRCCDFVGSLWTFCWDAAAICACEQILHASFTFSTSYIAHSASETNSPSAVKHHMQTPVDW